MTFAMWLLDPKTLVSAVFLFPLACGWVNHKTMRILLFACASNLMWLVGAQINLRVTGIATAMITVLVGISFVVVLPLDMLKRRRRYERSDYDFEDGKQGAILATNRFADLSTPVLEVIMMFSGQTMMIALYMNEMCSNPTTHKWFHPALWACGWVGQFMVYTQFGFNFKGEALFWRRVLVFSDCEVHTRKGEQPGPNVFIDTRELAFRSVLSGISNMVYRVFMWMSLPIYIARGQGGFDVVVKCVTVMYILTLSDLHNPVTIEPPEEGGMIDSIYKRRGDLEEVNRPLKDMTEECQD